MLRRLPLLDAELRQPGDDPGARFGGAHGLVDMENLSVGPDVERPAGGEVTPFGNHAVGPGRLAGRIRENGKVRAVHLGELGVVLQRVDAGHEVRDIELPNLFAARTERLAFGRSTAGEGFREPGNDDGLAFEVRKLVELAVRAAKLEVGRAVADGETR